MGLNLGIPFMGGGGTTTSGTEGKDNDRNRNGSKVRGSTESQSKSFGSQEKNGGSNPVSHSKAGDSASIGSARANDKLGDGNGCRRRQQNPSVMGGMYDKSRRQRPCGVDTSNHKRPGAGKHHGMGVHEEMNGTGRHQRPGLRNEYAAELHHQTQHDRSHRSSLEKSNSMHCSNSGDGRDKQPTLGNGYWTKFSENGEEFWVSLDDTNLSDSFSGDADCEVNGETQFVDSTNKNASRRSNYRDICQTPTNKNGRVRGNANGNDRLPEIPSSPFLVQQQQNQNGKGNKQQKFKPPHGDNSHKHSEHQLHLDLTSKNGGPTKTTIGNNFDHLVVNMVENEVKTKVHDSKRNSKSNPDTSKAKPEVIDRETIKQRLVAKYKPEMQKAGNSDTQSGKGKSATSVTEGEIRVPARQKSAKKGKPFGEKKNIHGFHTLKASSDKPLKRIGNNVYGFGN